MRLLLGLKHPQLARSDRRYDFGIIFYMPTNRHLLSMIGSDTHQLIFPESLLQLTLRQS